MSQIFKHPEITKLLLEHRREDIVEILQKSALVVVYEFPKVILFAIFYFTYPIVSDLKNVVINFSLTELRGFQ